MEGVRIISISNLLQLSLPLTGAASLHSPTPSPPPLKKHKTLNPNPNPNPNSNLSSKIFSPLNQPVLLIGTIDLQSPEDSNQNNSCKDHCFSFSDGSTKVCCAVLDLDDLKFIGRRVHVIAWNFLPFKHKNGGILEVIRWSVLPSEVGPSSEEHSIAPSHAFGTLKSVSPVFSVPCKNPTYGGDSVGFLAEITTCTCHLCSNCDLKNPLWEQNCHSFANSVFVYFLKPTSMWRPVLNKLVGKLVVISGLKKKLIFVGGEALYLMSVTTEKTVVSLCRLSVGVMSVGKVVKERNNEGGIYNGVVTGIYMQGMVVELDEKVWLLITDPMIAPQHSLRIGAIISVRNFHLVRPEFSWIRMLLLGTCVRTSIDIKSFSLSHTRSHFRTQSQSMLGKFIESLTLSARFWVLLLVSCFRRKFAKVLSDKEILGSKNHGVFMEFCKHDQCKCRNESNITPLKLVIPISNLISKCEEIWVAIISKSKYDAEAVGRNDHVNKVSCEATSCCCVIRRIISSEDLGFILMGTLKISSSSGRLQLVDATGCIDVVIPDLLSNNDVHSIYEVKDYKLVIEGSPKQLDSLEFHSSEALSCRNIFQQFPVKKVLNQLAVYVHFYLRDLTCLNIPFRRPSCKVRSDDLNGSTGEITHLLLVTHKFPATENFQDDRNISYCSSLFAEAIVLPYNLSFPNNNEYNEITEVFLDKPHTQSDYVESQKNSEKEWLKKPKFFGVPCRIKVNCSQNGSKEVKRRPSNIPCLFTFRSKNHQGCPLPGYLCYTESSALENIADNQWDQRILLEFNSDSFCKYQSLQLGGYYILKCSNRDLPSDIIGNKEMNCGKILINSQATLWSLSFSFGEIMHQKEPPQDHSSGVSSFGVSEAYLGYMRQSDVIFRQSFSQMHGTSDVHVHLSSEAVGSLNATTEAAEDGLIRLFPAPGEVLSVSSCIQIMEAEVARPLRTADPQISDLPQGNLISLCGNIKNVHIYNFKSRSYVSSQQYECINIDQRRACNIVIHAYDNHHTVQICGNFSKYAYPVGMGPGVNATFHRVLLTCTSSGCPRLVLTPVSFVVMNSIKEAGHQHSEKRCTLLSRLNILNGEPFDMVSLGLISQLTQCMESKLIRFHCRVVTVHVLVLEKHTYDPGNSQSRRQLKLPTFKIPLAGFVLDDGSSLCCCWANAGRAETLLRLHETTHMMFFNSCRSSKRPGVKNSRETVGYHVEKVLKKHRRIIVKNHRAAPESSSLGFTFSVDSDDVFSFTEERLLRFIILNACLGSTFNIVGNTMDSNALQLLDTELEELHVPVQPMRNVWITEVGYVNPLKEARNMLDELLTS